MDYAKRNFGTMKKAIPKDRLVDGDDIASIDFYFRQETGEIMDFGGNPTKYAKAHYGHGIFEVARPRSGIEIVDALYPTDISTEAKAVLKRSVQMFNDQ